MGRVFRKKTNLLERIDYSQIEDHWTHRLFLNGRWSDQSLLWQFASGGLGLWSWLAVSGIDELQCNCNYNFFKS